MAENSVYIDVPRSAVFAVLSDGWAYTNWVVGTSHMRAVEANWPQVGSKIYHAAGPWPVVTRDDTQVEQMEPDWRLQLLARGRPLGAARIELTLADDGAGCRVTMREEPVAGPGAWVHNPVSEALLKRRNTESLARLAAVAERRTTPSD